VRELAAREGISINQLVATALAEKMAALMTADYIQARARRGSRAKFLAALARVPDVDPDPWDRLKVEEPRKSMERPEARRRKSRRSRRETAPPRA
jgi:hypothetical protein